MEEQKKDQLNPISLVSSIFKFSIATWINAILYFVTLLLASYIFGGHDGVFGLYDLFYSASFTIMTIAMLGMDQAYIRFYHKPPKGIKNSRQLAAANMLFSIGTLGVLSLVFCLVLPREISWLFFEGDRSMTRFVVFICANALLLLVTRFFNITYRMQQKSGMYTIQTVLLQFFSRMFFLAGALVSPTLETLVQFSVAGLGVFALVFFLLQRRAMLPEKISYEAKAYGPLLKYGVALAPATIINYINNLFSRIYVNVMLGVKNLDTFTYMSYASLALGIIQSGFAVFWSAFIFGNYETEQRKIKRVHDYLTFIMLSVMTLILAAQPVIFMIFGAGFRAGANIFGIMMFAPLLLIISETTVYGIEIAKKTIYHSIGTAISVGGNVLLSIWLIPLLGIVGAAISLAVSGLAMFVFRTVVAQRFYRTIDHPAKTAASIFLMSALCAVSYLFSESPGVVTLAAFGLFAYYLVVYFAEFRRCLSIAGTIISGIGKKTA